MLKFYLGAAGGGTSYMMRKWAITTFRQIFGFASRDTDGKVVFHPPSEDGAVNSAEKMPSAFLARLALSLTQAILGGYVVAQSRKNPNVAAYGYGMSYNAIQNIFLSLLGKE